MKGEIRQNEINKDQNNHFNRLDLPSIVRIKPANCLDSISLLANSMFWLFQYSLDHPKPSKNEKMSIISMVRIFFKQTKRPNDFE